MASFTVTLPESCRGQSDHELKRILKAGLEVLIGSKCQFAIINGSYENGNGETTPLNELSKFSARNSLGIESKISKDNQIKNSSVFLNISFDMDVSTENISKAKDFVENHLSSVTDCIVREVPLASQRDFDMVVRNAASIQSASSTLLTFDRDTNKISIRGSQSNVTLAHSQIGKIIDNLGENELWSYSQSIESDCCIYNTQKDMTKSSEVCQTQTNLQDEDTLLKFIAEVSEPHAANIPHTTQRISQGDTEHDNDSSFSSSEEEGGCEDAGENIFLDRRFSKHVETGLKLGYSEDNVKKALLKLGENCDSNNLLSELIIISKTESSPVTGTEANQDGDEPPNTSIISTDGYVSHELAGLALSPNVISIPADSLKPANNLNDSSNLRHIIIDGSNVAMSHGKDSFSCNGIKIAVDWFKARGHKYITAFVPKWRKESSRPDAPITDQELLKDLERENVLAFTPARRVKGRRVVCYDDRFILKLAVETDGIVVSNDVYRDLVNEKEAFRQVVDQRLLMYTFVGDRFMPPEDPLGRSGPTLDNFLRKVPVDPRPRPQDCPFGKKCTYGNKCRFYHPERGFAQQKLVSETLKEQADAKLQERAHKMERAVNVEKERGRKPKQALKRTKSLIPGALPSSRRDSEFSGRNTSKSEKPKLAHSSSLNLSAFLKSSDYLEDARRTFEEAELLSATERLSLQQKSLESNTSFTSEPQNVSHPQTKSKNSPRLSPSDFRPQSLPPTAPADISAWQVGAASSIVSSGVHPNGGVLLEKTSVSSSGSNKSKPRKASPSHLPVPKQSERYVSGHLELAQKLSDEGSESNFFSEHTSSKSASSTPRTTSPVVLPSTGSAQKRRKSKGSAVKSENTGEVSQLRPELSGQVPAGSQAGLTDVANALAGIPNLSIFNEQGQNSLSQQVSPEQTEVTTGRRSSSIHGSSVASPFQPNTFTQSTGIHSQMDQHYKMPISRKMSEATMSSIMPKHMPLKSQSSVPVPGMAGHQAFADSTAWNFSSGLSRQNSSSDPQIHMSAVQHPHLTTSKTSNLPIQANGGGHGNLPSGQIQVGPQARHFNMPGVSYQNDYYNTPQSRGELQPSYQSQMYSQKLQQQQQTLQQPAYYVEQQNPSFGLNQFSPMGSRSSDGFGSTYSHGMQPPSGPALPSYQQEQPFLSPQYQVPQFAGPTNTSNHPQAMMGMQQMFPSPTAGYSEIPQTFGHPPPSLPPQGLMFQSYLNQPPPQMFYSVPAPVPQSNIRYPSPTNHNQMGPSVPLLPAEDIPIPTNDPRHALYCHLSTVFQESVVRKVMNRNPHLSKFDDVVSKIWDHVNNGKNQ